MNKLLSLAALTATVCFTSLATAGDFSSLSVYNQSSSQWIVLDVSPTGCLNNTWVGSIPPNITKGMDADMVKSLCNNQTTPCHITMYALPSDPGSSDCTKGTKIADTQFTLSGTAKQGHIEFTQVANGWKVTPGNADGDVNGNINEAFSDWVLKK